MATAPRDRGQMYSGIEGQVIVVTGAAGDLGRAICDQLAALGATVVGSDRRSPDGWPAANEANPFVICDVTDRQQVDGLVSQTQVMREFPERRTEVETVVPLGRLGEPSDVAACVTFLLSDASKYVTGSSFVVDGGIRLRTS